MHENDIGTIVIDTAIALHRQLGPGLLETVYEVTLAYELSQYGLTVARQVPISINYKGIAFDEAFRADLLLDDKVILEIKSIAMLTKVHQKQLLTYLRLTGRKLGYLLNFGSNTMVEGIIRVVNGLEENPDYTRKQFKNTHSPES